MLCLATLPVRVLLVALQLLEHWGLSAWLGAEASSTAVLAKQAARGLPAWAAGVLLTIPRLGAAARHRAFWRPGRLVGRRSPKLTRAQRRGKAKAEAMVVETKVIVVPSRQVVFFDPAAADLRAKLQQLAELIQRDRVEACGALGIPPPGARVPLCPGDQ